MLTLRNVSSMYFPSRQTLTHHYIAVGIQNSVLLFKKRACVAVEGVTNIQGVPEKRTFRMLQSVLGSKTLSGHNDRNLRMRTGVRSAVFVPRVLCSNLKVRFFLGHPVYSVSTFGHTCNPW